MTRDTTINFSLAKKVEEFWCKITYDGGPDSHKQFFLSLSRTQRSQNLYKVAFDCLYPNQSTRLIFSFLNLPYKSRKSHEIIMKILNANSDKFWPHCAGLTSTRLLTMFQHGIIQTPGSRLHVH